MEQDSHLAHHHLAELRWPCSGNSNTSLRASSFGPCGSIASFPDCGLGSPKFWYHFKSIHGGCDPQEWSTQIPHADGTFGPKAADEGLVVFMVGGQVNHPLGALAPGFKETMYYFKNIVKALDNYYDKNGLLGYTQWQSTTEHSGNMTMTIMYWRDVESLHRYTHGPEHMAGLQRWSKTRVANKYSHLSVFHETFVVPPGGNYENIYLNCNPICMGATTIPIPKNEDGTDKDEKECHWQRPIVDAKRGQLRTFARRIDRMDLTAHEKDDNDIWDATA